MISSRPAPEGTPPAVATLRSLECVRIRCHSLLQTAKLENGGDGLPHFTVNPAKLDSVVDFVQALMDRDYPNYDTVPFHSRWRHFEAGGINRIEAVTASWFCDDREKARRLVDLAMVSVLLDAGAGDRWKYSEKSTGYKAGRSEGLGVASLHMFLSGAFSSDLANPHRVDAKGLQELANDAVQKAFQAVDASNPLVGCDGRTQVLKRLGTAIAEHPEYFMRDNISRPGNLVDYMFSQSSGDGSVSVSALWEVVVYGLESIWPAGRTNIEGRSMGDVWRHSSLPDDGSGWSQLVPFHKLSQWMTYSLMEPLQGAGLTLTDTHLLTGLAEYRNGGLLIDMGVLVPKNADVKKRPQAPDSEVIVEWRALTVALLDMIYEKLRTKLGLTQAQFPLVKMLEGGTWKAGRVMAKERDPATGAPPIAIISDGTIF